MYLSNPALEEEGLTAAWTALRLRVEKRMTAAPGLYRSKRRAPRQPARLSPVGGVSPAVVLETCFVGRVAGAAAGEGERCRDGRGGGQARKLATGEPAGKGIERHGASPSRMIACGV